MPLALRNKLAPEIEKTELKTLEAEVVALREEVKKQADQIEELKQDVKLLKRALSQADSGSKKRSRHLGQEDS